jgi:hypothetical protein
MNNFLKSGILPSPEQEDISYTLSALSNSTSALFSPREVCLERYDKGMTKLRALVLVYKKTDKIIPKL